MTRVRRINKQPSDPNGTEAILIPHLQPGIQKRGEERETEGARERERDSERQREAERDRQ